MICDIHAHLERFDSVELERVLERAAAAGVTDIIMNSLEPKSFMRAEAIKRAYRGKIRLHLAAGFYPLSGLEADMREGLLSDAELDPDVALTFIESRASDIVAIGEVGLDFVGIEDAARERDEAILIRVLELAQRLEQPVIIHSRRAEERVIEILESYPNVRAVLHCFTGKKKLLVQALERKKTYFSIPVIVEHAEQFQQLVEMVPDSRLLTETDAPFLSPKDADHSEPAQIVRSIREIARIKKLDERECELMLYMNARRVFGF